MPDDILAIVLGQLAKLRPDHAELLARDNAASMTLQEFDLDSLDTLQLAMDLEEALKIEIEVVSMPETLTLARVAEQLARAKAGN